MKNKNNFNILKSISPVLISSMTLALFSLAHADESDSTYSHSPSADAEVTDAKASDRDAIESAKLKRITVVGDQEALKEVPGSAHLLTGEKLEEAKGGYDDVHRVLRRIPGVNIQEEDGYGLRPNIGLRGAPSERSENITLMEDGILIAPAPYSAPAAYYFPSFGRMEGVEVLKGAGQIKYGPRTTGGSLNLLSTSIPKDFGLNLTARAGQDDTFVGHLNLGESYRHGGWLIETYQAQTTGFKQLDGGGDTGFDLQDYNGKFRINTDPTAEFYQEVEVKVGSYHQDSDETYLGLTREDFSRNPFRRYRASQLDNLEVDHDQLHLTHYGELGSGLSITNQFYLNKTKRNWFKIESVNGTGSGDILDDPEAFADEYSWITGTDSPEGVFALRNNRRGYASRGFQTVLAAEFETGDVNHQLEVGARYHYDYEDRFQEEDKYKMENGSLVLSSKGAPGSNANRRGEADAFAFFVQDKVGFEAFTFTPGLRLEHIKYTRKDWGRADPLRLGTDFAENKSDYTVLIPGVGVNYEVSEEISVFTGIHKGFAPPGPSSTDDIDEEESINYELGLKGGSGSFDSQLVAFFNDYDNLLGADTTAAGGTGSGDLFNAGEARVWGVEAGVAYDPGLEYAWGFGLPLYVNYTYTDSEFRDDFSSTLFGDVSSGDRIPYIAKNQAAAGLAVEYGRVRTALDMFYVESMPTAAGSSSGQSVAYTDSHVVFDLGVDVKVAEGTTLFALVENIFDEEYIAALRPAGARPGRPQTFLAGVKFAL